MTTQQELFRFYTVNDTGRANLIAWLEDTLSDPTFADKHADALINAYDGGDVGASQIVEVRGMFTKDKNPWTYSFDPATELTLEIVCE